MHRAHVVACIRDREAKQSSSDSARGRNEGLEEGEDEQEENSGGAAEADNPMEEMVGAIEEVVPLATERAIAGEIEGGTTA